MSFDDMLDTSEALTNYTRTGRTDVSGLSPYASRYVKDIMKLGIVKAEKRLSKLNRAIVDANEILSKPQGNMHRVTTANRNAITARFQAHQISRYFKWFFLSIISHSKRRKLDDANKRYFGI